MSPSATAQRQAKAEAYVSDSNGNGDTPEITSEDFTSIWARKSPLPLPPLHDGDAKMESAASADSGYDTGSQQSSSLSGQDHHTSWSPTQPSDAFIQASRDRARKDQSIPGARVMRRAPTTEQRPTILQSIRRNSISVERCKIPGCTQCGLDAIETLPRQSRHEPMPLVPAEIVPNVSYHHDKRVSGSDSVQYTSSSSIGVRTKVRPMYYGHPRSIIQPSVARRLSVNPLWSRRTTYYGDPWDKRSPQPSMHQGRGLASSVFPNFSVERNHRNMLSCHDEEGKEEEEQEGNCSESETESEADDQPQSARSPELKVLKIKPPSDKLSGGGVPMASSQKSQSGPLSHTTPEPRRPLTVVLSQQSDTRVCGGNTDPYDTHHLPTTKQLLVPSVKSRSAYDTPQARVIVEGSRSSRRGSLQAYGRTSKEYRTKRQQEYNESRSRLFAGSSNPESSKNKHFSVGGGSNTGERSRNTRVYGRRTQGTVYWKDRNSERQKDVLSANAKKQLDVEDDVIILTAARRYQQRVGVQLAESDYETIYAKNLDDDNRSPTSSCAPSVFSAASLAPANMDLPRASSYSVTQRATAAKELIGIFQEEESLVALYRIAFEPPSIGAERLQCNLYRLFKVYAESLEEEAEDQLGFMASKLVSMKARHLAQCIVAKHNVNPTGFVVQAQQTDQPASSDDEENDRIPVDEKAFNDVISFREFLVEGEAFKKLRSQLKSFVSPKELESLHTELTTQMAIPHRQKSYVATAERSWQAWSGDVRRVVDAVFMDPRDLFLAKRALFIISDAIYLTTDALFIRFGLLEPPLAQNATRLRWTSKRGDHMFSDVVEYHNDGVAQLLPHLERSTSAKMTVASYNGQVGNQQYVAPRLLQWIRNGFVKLTPDVSRTESPRPCIPLYNPAGNAAATTISTNPPAPRCVLHLMACMHRDRSRKTLEQDLLEAVNTDRELFRFMQQQYIRHRGRYRNILSFKSVQGIYFVKFNLPVGRTVIVRDHSSHCAANPALMNCECIPPAAIVEPALNAQYRCEPGPPAIYPPIPSEHLRSLFSFPEDADETDDWILKKLPKRVCGKLQGQAGQPAEGWGVYYQEDWDRDIICVVIFSIFLVASALFGALWSIFKFDIQGAFGISAYMVAVCAALIPLIAMGADKPR